jgi:Spy/CpxP family protein refolding chaperone
VKAAAIVVAVFVLGVVTGGAVVYATRPAVAPAAPAATPPRTPEGRADLLTKRLGLTPAQRAEVVAVLERHVDDVRAGRDALRAEVRAILTPAQQASFDAVLRRGAP